MLSLSTARSSLEEMLESLRREEESQSPGDLPPALPPRPKATSRARLPSPKRRPSLPLPCVGNKEGSVGERENCFGAEKVEELGDGDEDEGNRKVDDFVLVLLIFFDLYLRLLMLGDGIKGEKGSKRVYEGIIVFVVNQVL